MKTVTKISFSLLNNRMNRNVLQISFILDFRGANTVTVASENFYRSKITFTTFLCPVYLLLKVCGHLVQKREAIMPANMDYRSEAGN